MPPRHFANNSLPGFDVNQALVLKEGDLKFWKKQLAKNPLPDMKALALRELAKGGQKDMPSLLEHTYFHSGNFVVRLEAMRLLALNYPEQAIKVLQAAINDSYELIRRFAAEYIEKNADPQLVPAFIQAYISRNHETRLMFKIQSGLSAFEPEVLLAEIDRQTKDKVFYNAAYVEQLKKQITNSAKGKQRDLDELADPTAKPSRQRLDIVVFRNHPSALAIDPLLKFIADDARDKQLRLSAIETLGWFNENYRRQEIISGLQNISTDDPDLQNEIKKTIRRLSPDGNTHE